MKEEDDWKSAADRMSSDWLDAEAVDVARQRLTAGPTEEGFRGHLADHRLVDALLSLLSADWQLKKERHVQQVMRVIRSAGAHGPHPAQRVQHPVVWRAALVAAACLGVWLAATWRWQLPAETRAAELLVEIRDVSRAEIDRVYAVHRHEGDLLGAREHVGTLFLRGVAGFVLACEGTVVGRDAEEFWLVSRNGDVVLSDDFEWLACSGAVEADELALLKQLSVESGRVPLMDLSAVVELMGSDYDVAIDTATRTAGAEARDQIVARRRTPSGALPETISLSADSATHVVQHAELLWRARPDKPWQHRLVLDLVPERIVGEKWYRHATHHPHQARVRRILPSGTVLPGDTQQP